MFVLERTKVPAPALVKPNVPPDCPTAPAKVVTAVFVTVKVRVAVRVAAPVKVRLVLPPKLTLPPSVTAWAKEIAPPLALSVPALRVSVPVPRALLLPANKAPPLMVVPPE